MRVASISRRKREQGYSLIELSIVLVVMGLVASALLSFGISQSETSRRELTSKRLDDIDRALGAFFIRNGHLPCPMVGWLPPEDEDFGRADTSASCGDTGVETDASVAGNDMHVGTVPFASLGLTDEFMLDAWNRRITYVVDTRFTTFNGFMTTDPRLADQGRIEILVSGDASSGIRRTTQAGVVLISHGTNGHGAWPIRQTPPDTNRINPDPVALSISAGEVENAHVQHPAGSPLNHNNIFTQEPYSASFDDLVRYMERWQVIEKAGGIVDMEFCTIVWRTLQSTDPNVTPRLGPVGCVSTYTNDGATTDYNCEQRQRQLATLNAQLCGIRR